MDIRLHYNKSIMRWDEAIPLGNGQCGCLVWGDGRKLHFSLDRTDIWDRRKPLNTEKPEYSYQSLIQMAKAGDEEGIRMFFDKSYNHPFPTKLPAGRMTLSFPEGGNVRSELSLASGEACLEVEAGQGTREIRSLLHAVNGTGMLSISGSCKNLEVSLENPEFGNEEDAESYSYDPEHRTISPSSLKSLRYPKPVKGMEERSGVVFQWFVQQVDPEFSYGILLAIQKGEDKTLIFYRILTSREGEGWLSSAKDLLFRQLGRGYEEERRSHAAWWEEFWGKSSIHVPEGLFEKQWYLTNYLFASCSRKGCFPMPLQGVWTADDGMLPPWKGDYHHDLNTQLSYTHFYKANHLEEGQCFLDFLWNLRDAGKRFAKSFYGTEGLCMPGVMTIDGEPLGGWPMYSLSPTHQIWLCQSFDLYYRYTGDEKFLRERAWIYFQDTAKCLTALLRKGEDGKLYLPVSSSPEIHDDSRNAWLTPNSNYDLALLIYLYQTLEEYSQILGNGEEEKWRRIREELPELAVNEQNVLMLSPDESLEESHRHLSNAMAVCPLGLLDYEDAHDREIIDATVLDYERLGTGMWVGFSFAWMSHLYTVQGNGEGAREQLRIFWESFCGPNGFHLNGDFKKRGYSTFHYRPFTLESNMYAADALQEMLLRSRKGKIELFPAIPENWKEKGVSFEGFRGEGGILVSAAMESGELTKFRIFSPRAMKILWKSQEGERVLSLKEGEELCIL